ncbi:MAG: sulfite exporter TauE/SafE family protein [Magnetococcales bacterium]|nr:sulfite exporter TauE/SafE family protein [Magnetococcales bacterium]NGZ27627.1 sulfite exporter TauE/SafE family protein [Magnetococcales bacterium]
MPLMIDWPEIIAAWAIMAASALLQGCVGFGYALVAGPLLILLGPHWVPGPLILGAVALTISTWRRDWRLTTPEERRSIVKEVLWSTLGRLPGIALGATALLWIPQQRMGLLVGGMVLLAVGMSLVTRPFHPQPATLIGAGLLSGFMGTTASVGGPPMAILYQWLPANRFRVTLAVFFTFGAILSVLGLAIVGRFGLTELMLGILMTPGVMAGFFLSNPLVGHLEKKNLRPWVLALATLSALAAIQHGLRHL